MDGMIMGKIKKFKKEMEISLPFNVWKCENSLNEKRNELCLSMW